MMRESEHVRHDGKLTDQPPTMEQIKITKSGDSLGINATRLFTRSLGLEHEDYVEIRMGRADQPYAMMLDPDLDSRKRREFAREVSRLYDETFHDDESTDE